MATQPSRLEANRLYWDTDSSVGHIAERLGVSRRALYELLDPVAADGPCPGCGQPLLFANRLARAAGEAICRGCGASKHVAVTQRVPEAQREAAAPLNAPTARSRRNGHAAEAVTAAAPESPPSPAATLGEWTSPLGIPRPLATPVRIAAVALLALAAGVAIAAVVRHRSR